MNEGRELICNIGQVKLGRGEDTLRATLGSCVGIGILWKKEKRCALAHCLLAEAEKPTFEVTARYVSQAIPSLLLLLKIPKDRYDELEVIVAGGAQMMGIDSSSGTRNVGRANVESALKRLRELGLRIVHQDTGGGIGRQISIHCGTFDYAVRLIGSEAA